MKIDDVKILVEQSQGNAGRVRAAAQRCGCYSCGALFESSEILDVYPERDGSGTAICPRCGVDTVLCVGDCTQLGVELMPESLELIKKIIYSLRDQGESRRGKGG